MTGFTEKCWHILGSLPTHCFTSQLVENSRKVMLFIRLIFTNPQGVNIDKSCSTDKLRHMFKVMLMKYDFQSYQDHIDYSSSQLLRRSIIYKLYDD